MSVPLLNAEAAPEDAALWLQLIQEQNPGYNPRLASGRLHGRLTKTPVVTLLDACVLGTERHRRHIDEVRAPGTTAVERLLPNTTER